LQTLSYPITSAGALQGKKLLLGVLSPMDKSSSIMLRKSCVVEGQFANADLSTGFDLFVNFKIGLPSTAQADGSCTNVKEVQKSASNNIYFYINHSLFDPLGKCTKTR
jgi:hypothetical protein